MPASTRSATYLRLRSTFPAPKGQSRDTSGTRECDVDSAVFRRDEDGVDDVATISTAHLLGYFGDESTQASCVVGSSAASSTSIFDDMEPGQCSPPQRGGERSEPRSAASADGFYARTFYPDGYVRPLPGESRRRAEESMALLDLTSHGRGARAAYQNTGNRHDRPASAATRTTPVQGTTPCLSVAQMNEIAPSVILVDEAVQAAQPCRAACDGIAVGSGSKAAASLLHAICRARRLTRKLRRGGRGQATSSPTSERFLRGEERGEVCVICLETWGLHGQVVRTLCCGHTLHSTCIDAWCSRKARCPIDNRTLGQCSDS
jgi:Ring finger domain